MTGNRSSAGLRAVGLGAGPFVCGIAAAVAARAGMWGLLTGAAGAALWLGAVARWPMASHPPASPGAGGEGPANEGADQAADRLLLDAAPTPMLAVDAGKVRALNRAARRLFATDDRVAAPPAALADAACDQLRLDGRHWRIDRVMLSGRRMVAALIDVEQEERIAEARATAEMIHVLGHELLNGLAPIVSLAESGEAALRRPVADPDLLREIFGTLGRRAEGLRRFTEAYRSLARLPEPQRRATSIDEMVADLQRLFEGRFPLVPLAAVHPPGLGWTLDRDQIAQAVWALLQNAAEAASTGEPGRGRIRLSIGATPAGLAIDVEDDGPGVPPDRALAIFRPFHTTKPGGTGVGLSLARQIALAHGGALTLEPAARTTFRLRLPG